jgi:hypothetical protein
VDILNRAAKGRTVEAKEGRGCGPFLAIPKGKGGAMRQTVYRRAWGRRLRARRAKKSGRFAASQTGK